MTIKKGDNYDYGKKDDNYDYGKKDYGVQGKQYGAVKAKQIEQAAGKHANNQDVKAAAPQVEAKPVPVVQGRKR